MIRRIIKIDTEKCNGCGACAAACHEGAIDMVNGKAHLAREHYCDGLGDCLPACPTGAIAFEQRQAPAYDAAAVAAAKAADPAAPASQRQVAAADHAVGCPGAAARRLAAAEDVVPSTLSAPTAAPSRLAQWPCQIRLVSPYAPCFAGAQLLVAADCTAYAFAAIHETYMKGRVTLIGCPKLDAVDYSEKLARILAANDVQSLLVLRMEVPCCGGLVQAVQKALAASGKTIPCRVVTVGIDGGVMETV